MYRDWFEFIFHRSIWSSAFLKRKSFKENIDWFRVDLTKNISFVLPGLIAIRNGYEHPERLVIFKKLKEQGIDEHIAFLVCCAFKAARGYANDYFFARAHMSGQHDVFYIEAKVKSLLKMFKGGYGKKENGTRGGFNDPFASWETMQSVYPEDGDRIGQYLTVFFSDKHPIRPYYHNGRREIAAKSA